MAKKKSLLDEDDSSSGSESSADETSAQDTQFKVNKKYARAFQERKQREELKRVRERDEDIDSDDSSSEEEDDNGRLLTSSMNLKFLKLMKALRKKDDTIYDKSARFFDEGSNEDEERSEKKDKVKKYKDVLREQILEQVDEDESREAGEEKATSQSRFAYDAQQEEIRNSFLKNAGGSDDEDSDEEDSDWMVLKSRKEPSLEEKEALSHFEEIEEMTKQEQNKTIDPRGEVEDGDKFLLDFLKQKKWVDKDGDYRADDDSIDDLDKADDFEAHYNFRFEQAEAEVATSGAMLSVQTFARGNTMNTVRRADTTRKEKRESRRERKAAERKAKEEQLKRLKNAKQQEARQKLSQIKAVLGSVDRDTVDEVAIMKMLEGEYDPEQFEKAMNEAYGDDFYQKEDEEWKTDIDVRQYLMGDEDGEEIIGEDNEGGLYDTNAAEEEEDDYNGNEQDWGDDEEVAEEEDAAPESELEKKAKMKMQEELYKLDYEDIVAGMPTRFKYRQVEKNDYGLSTHEILLARDSTLKQYVSLKKMAPYNEDGEHHANSKKRRRFREALTIDMEEFKAQEEANIAKSAEQNEVEEGDEEPKKKKRRRLKKGKKRISESATNETLEKAKPKETPEKEGSKKRRRKKKGKKGGSSDSNPQDDAGKTQVEEKRAIDNTYEEQKIKAPSSTEGKKRRKKKNKKKKEAMGLSATRLSSYGL